MDDEVKEPRVAYDHKGKMKQYREDWGEVGVKGILIMLPVEYGDYFKAMGKLLMAKKALAVIEGRDPEILDVLSNRKIRLGIDRTELLMLVALYKDYGDDSSMKDKHADASSILDLYDMMGIAKANGSMAMGEGKSASATYWWARECALALYISGAVELIKARDTSNFSLSSFKI